MSARPTLPPDRGPGAPVTGRVPAQRVAGTGTGREGARGGGRHRGDGRVRWRGPRLLSRGCTGAALVCSAVAVLLSAQARPAAIAVAAAGLVLALAGAAADRELRGRLRGRGSGPRGR
ncbi:hypothetical protein [Kineococcus sp. SYSU DK006]|uniref:hypothetical protein n=1 Tax=Kineococcus sp. SYSU DK006 TaxID=3383127 RepID=UPI003D7DD799